MNPEQEQDFQQKQDSFPMRRGAEASVYIGLYDKMPCLIKERTTKAYRHSELDRKITRQRMRAEQRGIARCEKAGIRVPQIYKVEMDTHKIYMEYLANTQTVKAFIDELANMEKMNEEIVLKNLRKLCELIGLNIGKMHFNDIIHGDLTTSNILIECLEQAEPQLTDPTQLIFVDFGLSSYSHSIEDKAVDLYVLERALLTTHSQFEFLFDEILKFYQIAFAKEESNNIDAKNVLNKLDEVRSRGRKKIMIG